jgi:hypothetical protein
MPFDFGLLSNAALTGLSQAEQDSLQRQATSQFLLGSILGGDPSVGFRSAMSVPEQYTSAQKNILELRQKAADRQSIADFQTKYLPTQFNETSPEFRGPVTPDVESSQNDLAAARSRGLPFNIQNALQDVIRLPTAAQGPIRETISSLQPKVQDGLLLNPNMEILRGLPTQKDGVVSQYNPLTRGYSAAPVQNYMESRILSTPPEITPNTRLVPVQGGGIEQQPIPGATASVQAIEAAKAVGQAAGQLTDVIGPDGKTYKVPTSTLLGQTNRPAGQPTTGQTAPGQPGVAGAVTKISPAQEAVNASIANRFNEFTKNALDAAATVNDRKTSAEYLYNAAEQLDPNKATDFIAAGASYIRAIPGVGDRFDSFVGNVNLLNKTRSEGVLKGLSNIKGNANAFEGGIVDRATTGVTDPRFVTKYVSALEIAAADKDDARQRFLDAYTGDPKNVYTEWSNSPNNPRIYNHPKVNQFLSEQVAAWQRGGSQGTPVMPSGFTVGRSKSTGAILIKKPDGSTYTVGQ